MISGRSMPKVVKTKIMQLLHTAHLIECNTYLGRLYSLKNQICALSFRWTRNRTKSGMRQLVQGHDSSLSIFSLWQHSYILREIHIQPTQTEDLGWPHARCYREHYNGAQLFRAGC